MPKITLIAHNIRSTHNVGSLLRTADCLGIDEVIFSGYTPHPKKPYDDRLPHIAEKLSKQISKTALGAEESVKWSYTEEPFETLQDLRHKGYEIVALEQAGGSIDLKDFHPKPKLALVIGEEVNGIEPDLQKMADKIIEIPMKGKKESLNVAIATSIALYQLTQ